MKSRSEKLAQGSSLFDATTRVDRRSVLMGASVFATLAALGVNLGSPQAAQAAQRFSWPFPLELAFREYGPRDFPADPFHKGIDFSRGRAGVTGTVVPCAGKGVVTVADSKSKAFNHWVMIDHGDGLVTRYHMMGTLCVGVGQAVRMGDPVGTVGPRFGTGTAPHLHFQTEVGGRHVNPRDFMSAYGSTYDDIRNGTRDMALRFVRNKSTGLTILASFETGLWYPIPNPAYYDLISARLKVDTSLTLDVPENEFRYFESIATFARG